MCRDCIVQFENGLLYGTWLLRKEEAGGPFPARLDLHEAIGSMRSYKMGPNSPRAGEDARPLGGYLDELFELDGRVSILVRTCFRMIERLFANGPGMFNPQALRFLFFAGLVASGVLIPAAKAAEELQEPGEAFEVNEF